MADAGVGPFTAANMLQLLGHYSRIPCDSETVRHLHKIHNLHDCTLANVQHKAQQVSQSHASCLITHARTGRVKKREIKEAVTVDCEYRMEARVHLKLLLPTEMPNEVVFSVSVSV